MKVQKGGGPIGAYLLSEISAAKKKYGKGSNEYKDAVAECKVLQEFQSSDKIANARKTTMRCKPVYVYNSELEEGDDDVLWISKTLLSARRRWKCIEEVVESLERHHIWPARMSAPQASMNDSAQWREIVNEWFVALGTEFRPVAVGAVEVSDGRVYELGTVSVHGTIHRYHVRSASHEPSCLHIQGVARIWFAYGVPTMPFQFRTLVENASTRKKNQRHTRTDTRTDTHTDTHTVDQIMSHVQS
jgi:hypothetical protein